MKGLSKELMLPFPGVSELGIDGLDDLQLSRREPTHAQGNDSLECLWAVFLTYFQAKLKKEPVMLIPSCVQVTKWNCLSKTGPHAAFQSVLCLNSCVSSCLFKSPTFLIGQFLEDCRGAVLINSKWMEVIYRTEKWITFWCAFNCIVFKIRKLDKQTEIQLKSLWPQALIPTLHQKRIVPQDVHGLTFQWLLEVKSRLFIVPHQYLHCLYIKHLLLVCSIPLTVVLPLSPVKGFVSFSSPWLRLGQPVLYCVDLEVYGDNWKSNLI